MFKWCVRECICERQRDESLEEDLDIGGDSCQPVFQRPDIPHTPVTLYVPPVHVHAHAASHTYMIPITTVQQLVECVVHTSLALLYAAQH